MISRSVDDQSVPLSFNVIVRRLVGDVEAGKLQLPRYLLLPLEHNQRNLQHKAFSHSPLINMENILGNSSIHMSGFLCRSSCTFK